MTVIPSLTTKKAVRNAWIAWAVLFLTTAAIIASGSGRTVVPAYREGALYWVAGKVIYQHLGVGGFVYLPQAAILFIPFSLLPVVAGEVLWRLVNIGVFALGLRGTARLLGARQGTELFPLMTLVTLPLAWDCARNGQATLALTGLMLLSVAAVAQRRYWWAILWLSLGVSVKPLMIVLFLLIMAIDRPMTWRLVVGMLLTVLFPFAVQRPGYVMEQYAVFWSGLTKAAHVGATVGGWTSPFHALALVGVDVPERVQMVFRLAAAAATLALCAVARKRYDAEGSALFVFSLAAAYLMLFSPRTENNTYAMLAPAIAAFLALAVLIERRSTAAALLSGITAGLIGSRLIERLLTPHASTSWVSPLMAVCFTAFLVVQLFAQQPEQRTDTAVPAS
jgi:hypothetical protein